MKKIKLLFVVLFSMLISLTIAQDGMLDPTFGTNGIFKLRFGANYAAHDFDIQHDGKIVIAGCIDFATHKDPVVVRLNPDGSLDTSFDRIGFTTFEVNDSDMAIARTIKVVGNKILVAGFSGTQSYLTRLNMDGSIDNTFGIRGGIITMDILYGINDIQIIPRIDTYDILLAGGYTDVWNTRPGLVKFTENGLFITAFGTNGRVTLPSSVKGYFTGISVGINSIVAIGVNHEDGVVDDDALIAKFDLNGSLHRPFGGGSGYVLVDAPIANKRNDAYSFFNTFGGSISFCGEYTSGSSSAAYVCRLNPDGSIDESFGDDGYRHSVQTQTMRAIALEPGGKIVLGGSSKLLGNPDFNIIRLLSNGDDDNTFGINGWTLTDFGGMDEIVDLEFQSDGKLVAVGISKSGMETSIAVARYIMETTSIDAISETKTIEFALEPNPNYGGQFQLKYEVPMRQYIEIDLLSIDGQKTYSVLRGEHMKGVYNESVLLPKDFVPGLYLLRIRTAEKIMTKKIICM